MTQPTHPAPTDADPQAPTAPVDPWPAPGQARPPVVPPPAPATPPQPASGPSGAPPAAPPPRPRRSTPWLPLAATVVATALVTSLATAGLVGAFDREDPAPPAQEEAAEPAQVPVTSSSADDPDWRAVADAVRPSVVAIDVRTPGGTGQGSGVVVDDAGHVLTNDHVVGDAVDGGIVVTLHDGRVLEAEVVGTDPTTDLAVVRLLDPPDDLVAATLGDSDEVRVGDPVMAVGNPLGLDSTVTTGIVSALDRPVTTQGETSAVVTNAIQVDAAINPGNSGGPLFDARGRVVGITSSIAMLPGGQSGSIGLGFAIPSDLAERVAGELVEDGTAEHAFLGVGLADGTAEVDGVTRRGAVVREVTEGSPADEAGLAEGDVVVAIGDDPVSGAESLTAFVREHSAGEEATLTVVRDGEQRTVDVTFAVREEQADQPAPERRRDELPEQRLPDQLPWDWFGR